MLSLETGLLNTACDHQAEQSPRKGNMAAFISEGLLGSVCEEGSHLVKSPYFIYKDLKGVRWGQQPVQGCLALSSVCERKPGQWGAGDFPTTLLHLWPGGQRVG